MIKILMHGACGRMGQMIADVISVNENVEISVGVDTYGKAYSEFPIYRTLNEVHEDIDVVIDFSNPEATNGLLDFCVQKKLPIVLCTTGLTDAQNERIKKISKETAVLKSANMSIGINLLLRILNEVSPVLKQAGFDVDIVEKHHSKKLDSPSGTALALADAVNESLGGDYEYVSDRTKRRNARPDREIGISSVRGGTIPGDHDIIFAGRDEVITFSHSVYSRVVFAKGAVMAAEFLSGKRSGLYSMKDVIDFGNENE